VFRVLLIAEARPRRIALLAEQIERHVEGAKICGVIYRQDPSSRSLLAFRILERVRSIGTVLNDIVLAFVHGGRPSQSVRSQSAIEQLSSKCSKEGWNFCIANNWSDPQVLDFTKKSAADLGIALGEVSVPVSIANLPRRGIVQGKLASGDPQRLETAAVGSGSFPGTMPEIRVLIHRVSAARKGSELAHFSLMPQPLDTSTSLELKGSVVLRDLLVQTAMAIGRDNSDEEVSARIESWIQTMIPLSFFGADEVTSQIPVDQPPPLYVRPKWKLFAYSCILASPFVTLRNWIRRLRRRHAVLFLNSHLISDRYHRMTLPTEAFLREIRFLQQHYQIVGLSEACRLLKAGFVERPIVVLTFDDGYEDNFINLRAVSEELSVPVVMFVSTDPVTAHKEFTHDLVRGLRGFRALTWDQIRYWSADGTEFQSHTCSHFDCGSTDVSALRRELVDSKHELEKQLRKRVTSFAFPFGKPKNMSKPAMAIAGETYDHFLSSFGGENFPKASETHKHLRRKHLQGNAWESELELQGAFELVLSIRHSLNIHFKSPKSNQLGITTPVSDRETH
jgi:peptidoglycan/xylan/chitin deacetylase (PgdA/CDA1 family)